ncbi:transporter substrate-binding domain-containing protein [Rhodobacteraceae bacterium RKSG542]|uniref:ABC transporter substrate-binding protein n=1 Tax=Pseudovibrio flavus TaxID=2529854 RepID=UPI0012BB8E0E|nr:ABC transporter substrate-binding protein [Pseudovibrio flavus]MTI17358.1 transporter substrate-binding domain-containing protein [Pseudovibrio flavus]
MSLLSAVKKVGAAAALAATVAFAGAANASEKVTIQIEGAAVPYYLPMFVAEHYGYFDEAGLDVEFLYADGASILSNIAAGNVEFGFPNGDPVIAARANGLPVKVIHSTYQQGIGAVLFKQDSGIKTAADLAGKKVAVTSYGSPNYIQLQVMMAKEGKTIDDVNVEIVGTGAILDALKSDQVDAIVFSMLRYFALQAEGVNPGMIASDDYLPSHGNVLVTSEALLAEKPEVAAGFIAALNKAINHIVEGDVAKEVELVIAEYTPTFAGQEEMVTTIIEEIFAKTLWTSENTGKFELGYGDRAAWQESIDTALKFETIPEGFDAADLVVELPSKLK